MKTKMKKMTPAACYKMWRRLYGKAVDSDFTVECDTCGSTLFGDQPSIVIDCLHCFCKKRGVSKKAIDAYTPRGR